MSYYTVTTTEQNGRIKDGYGQGLQVTVMKKIIKTMTIKKKKKKKRRRKEEE